MQVMKKNNIGPLYSETKKMKVFWIKKKFKTNKTNKTEKNNKTIKRLQRLCKYL